MTEETGDIVSDIKSAIWDIEDNLERLLHRLETEMERILKEENEGGEACFDLLLKAGFTIGTRFIYKFDNTKWTITGINPKGFVLTAINNGEIRKSRLPAYDMKRLKEKMELFEIIEQPENSNA